MHLIQLKWIFFQFKRRLEEKIDDKYIAEFNLILFDFGSTDPGEGNKVILEKIRSVCK